MKPRTRLEKKVVELSEQLPALTEEQRRWAEEHCFKKTGYLVRKDTVWCHECGTEFKAQIPPLSADVVGAEAVCPVCGKKLEVTHCRARHHYDATWFTVLTTMKGMQVCRHFDIRKYSNRGEPGAQYSVSEIVQNWVTKEGKEAVIARSLKFGYYYDFSLSTDMTLKKPHRDYNINAYYTYPVRRILPIIRRNGYTAKFHELAPSELFRLLLTDHEAEVLMKAGRWDILMYRYTHMASAKKFDPLIKVAIRHGYYPRDVDIWFDYLDGCMELGFDVHNPHYLCPRNLAEAHDAILKKIDKKRAEDKKKREIETAKRYESEYAESKGKFFGICFGDENIVITVIKSVAEMAEEGNAMHHCVFAMKYYKKPESLILSAKDKKGNRVETIELSLKTFEVLQSRGVCNENSEYHDEILKLMKNNVNLIRQAV